MATGSGPSGTWKEALQSWLRTPVVPDTPKNNIWITIMPQIKVVYIIWLSDIHNTSWFSGFLFRHHVRFIVDCNLLQKDTFMIKKKCLLVIYLNCSNCFESWGEFSVMICIDYRSLNFDGDFRTTTDSESSIYLLFRFRKRYENININIVLRYDKKWASLMCWTVYHHLTMDYWWWKAAYHFGHSIDL